MHMAVGGMVNLDSHLWQGFQNPLGGMPWRQLLRRDAQPCNGERPVYVFRMSCNNHRSYNDSRSRLHMAVVHLVAVDWHLRQEPPHSLGRVSRRRLLWRYAQSIFGAGLARSSRLRRISDHARLVHVAVGFVVCLDRDVRQGIPHPLGRVPWRRLLRRHAQPGHGERPVYVFGVSNRLNNSCSCHNHNRSSRLQMAVGCMDGLDNGLRVWRLLALV